MHGIAAPQMRSSLIFLNIAHHLVNFLAILDAVKTDFNQIGRVAGFQ